MKAQERNKELPPFVKSWKQFYLLLMGWLLLLMIVFYIFTLYFK